MTDLLVVSLFTIAVLLIILGVAVFRAHMEIVMLKKLIQALVIRDGKDKLKLLSAIENLDEDLTVRIERLEQKQYH